MQGRGGDVDVLGHLALEGTGELAAEQPAGVLVGGPADLQLDGAGVVRMAEDLVRQDREINRLNREVFALAIEVGTDIDTREWAMHMVMMAGALERVGDNAIDIAEQTAFVVTGLFREFSDSSTPPPPG